MKEGVAVLPARAESTGISEARKPRRHCLYIPGILTTEDATFGKSGMYKALIGQYGEGNVTTFNSAISTDYPSYYRYYEMAEVIMERAPKEPLDIVLYSLGATEFLKVKKIIKRRNKKFFRDPQVKANIHFIKIGESGASRGPIERLRYVREALKLRKGHPLESLYAFPPDGVSPEKITTIYARESNKRPDYPTIPLTATAENTIFLTEREQVFKKEADGALQRAVARKDFYAARRISKLRRRMLDEPVQAVLAGDTERKTAKQKIKIGGLQGVHLLWNAIGGKPMRHLRRLYREGYGVSSLIAEFDRLTTAAKSARFYANAGESKRHLSIVEGAPHDGNILRVNDWAKAIFSRRVTKPAAA